MKDKNRAINRLILIGLSIFLTACTTTLALYDYPSYPDKGFSNSYNKILDISAMGIDIQKEDSPVKLISVYDRQYDTFAEIVSPTVKIVDRSGKEYTLRVNRQYKYAIDVYEQGVILQGEFKVSIGKVRRKDGSIVDVPPLVFRQHVDVDKWNPILDTMNIETGEKVFEGTVEDYKKGDWKEKKKK